jgi:uncharacterized membrane protein
MSLPDALPPDSLRRRIEAWAHLQLASVKRFVRTKLLWNHAYRAWSYVKSALWVVPLVAILLVFVTAPVLRVLDSWLDWRIAVMHVAGAKALYETVITLTLSFIVFTFGSLLVAIQIAGGQLTPRIIATTLLRDNVVRFSVGLFFYALVFSISALDRLQDEVYALVSILVAILGVICMAVFLFLIDHAARLLRPVSIVARVGDHGLRVIRAVYPQLAREGTDESDAEPLALGPPRRIVCHAGRSEIVLAVDMETLVAEAVRHGGVVELVPQVGDFLAQGEALFALHGGAVGIDDRKLSAAVAFGVERTMEQDPMFAFRILADIGLKALSPAINDPTTAVLTLDQIHRLLREVGRRRLRGEVVRDERGEPRVIYRTPNWEDYVHVACQEIRSYGAGNVQVARRFRALFENLLAALPPNRHEVLELELNRLEQMIETLYPMLEDRELARIPDSQGLGGSSREARARR